MQFAKINIKNIVINYMSELYQKFHGLPGIGINGSTGEKGQKGNNIYFGYINSFFDGVQINPVSYVYVAQRLNAKYSAWENKVDALNNKLLQNMSQSDRTAIVNYLSATANSYAYYYTGTIYNYDAKYCSIGDATINDYKLDFSNDGQIMAAMLYSANGNAVTINYAQNVYPYKSNSNNSSLNNCITSIDVSVDNQKCTYNEIYNYVLADNEYKLGDSAKIKAYTLDNKPILTYDANDAAYLAYQQTTGNNFNADFIFDKGTGGIQYNKVWTYLDKSFNASTYANDSIVEYVNDIIEFIKDDNISCSVLTGSVLFKASVQNNNIVREQAEGDLLNAYSTIFTFDPNQYFKTSIASSYNGTEYSKDYANYSFSALSSDVLFLNNISGSDDAKSLDSYSLKSYVNDEKYISNVETYQDFTRDNILSDDENIRYIINDTSNYIIPTTLKSDFLPGDVLYFYTKETTINDDIEIEYMVILDEIMMNCTVNQLISYAQVANPLDIKQMIDMNDRIQVNNGAIIIKNDATTDNEKHYNKSISSIIGKDSNAGLILSNANSTNIIDLNVAYRKNYKDTMSLYVNDVNIDQNQTTIDANMIKASNLYICDKKDSNMEKYNYLYDSNIKQNNGFVATISNVLAFTDKNNDTVLGGMLSANTYFYDTYDMTNYIYGYDIVDSNNLIIQQQCSSTARLPMFFNLNGIDSFKIFVWAASNTGLKYYSHCTQVNVQYQMVPAINNNIYTNNLLTKNQIKLITPNPSVTPAFPQLTKQYVSHSVEILGSDQLRQTNVSNNIKFSWTNINVGKNNDVSLIICPSTNNIQITKIMFDYVDISTNQTITINDWSSITCIDCSTNAILSLDISTNIPGYDTISDFIVSKNEIEVSNNDSKLFNDIVNNKNNVKTSKRDILAIIEYYDINNDYLLKHKIDENIYYKFDNLKSVNNTVNFLYNDNGNIINFTEIADIYINEYDYSLTEAENVFFYVNKDCTTSNVSYFIKDEVHAINLQQPTDLTQSNLVIEFDINDILHYDDPNEKFYRKIPEKHYDSFEISQPGFKDYRDVPDIQLDMHNSLIDIQNYNTLDNNVNCNQFITYMGINVSNFNETWGYYANQDISISLSFDVENISTDIKWQSNNIVKNYAPSRSTMKLFLENYEIDSSTKNENYVLLQPTFVKTSNSLYALSNDVSAYDNSNYSIDTSIQVYKNLDTSYNPSTYNTSDDKEYILVDSSIVEYCSQPEYIFNGIQDNIKLHFDNVHIDDLKDNTLYLKLLYENGNPMISNLYLRFAVTNVVINVSTDSNNVSFYANVTPPSNETDYIKRLFTHHANNDYSYTYMSEPLDVNINPMTYCVCPAKMEQNITNMQGDVYKSGSDEQISTLLEFYNKDIYENSSLMSITNVDARDNMMYNQKSLKLKASYLQDSVQNIVVKPYNNLSSNNLFNSIYDDSSISDNYDDQYLAVQYHGGLMNAKQRNEKYTFYYNNTAYDLDRYSQYALSTFVDITDSKALYIKDDQLFDSINEWNKVFLTNSNKYKNAVTFTGDICLYGNGYYQLLASVDTGQFDDTSIYSLSETKQYANAYIYDSSAYNRIVNNDVKINEPFDNDYFRTFVWDVDWIYNQELSENNYRHYQIVSNFDILLKYAETISQPIQKYSDKLAKLNDKNAYMLPYTLLFDIYPRATCNFEDETINMLMLRRPCIENDSDLDGSFDSCYNLNTHYFEIFNQ